MPRLDLASVPVVITVALWHFGHGTISLQPPASQSSVAVAPALPGPSQQ